MCAAAGNIGRSRPSPAFPACDTFDIARRVVYRCLLWIGRLRTYTCPGRNASGGAI